LEGIKVESAVFGLIGVLVGAILTGVREWWFQNRKNRKDAEYLAIQVSCQLEKFIAGCAGVAGDDGLCEGQTDKDGYRSIQVESPTLALNDLKVEWKVLPANLMYSILQFPYKAELVAQKTMYEFNHASPPDYSEAFEERQLQYSILGIDASRLVAQLLKHVALPEAKPDEWDPIAFMRDQKAKIDSLRQNRAADHRNLFEENKESVRPATDA
jgi:hypothetical protein